LDKLKELFGNILSGKNRSIQLKIFGILFFFLIIQAGVQLYVNISQGQYALQEITQVMRSGMREFSSLGKKELRAVEKSRKVKIDTMGRIIMSTVKYAMTAGHAEMVRNHLERIGEDEQFFDVSLYRANKKSGEKAFQNNATINTVNKRLDKNRFAKHKLKPAEFFDSSHMKEFKRVASGSRSVVRYEEKIDGKEALTGLYGITNDNECQYCHGKDDKVRGVLKISISVAESNRLEASIKKELGTKETAQAVVKSELKLKAKNARNLSIFAAILLTAITLVATNLFLRFTLVKPVDAISQVAGRIAEGDLTASIDRSRGDEIGMLSNSLAKMQASLKTMIDQINESSSQVSHSASELADLSNHMAIGSGKQTDKADRVATAVEEMTVTILEIAKNSGDALDSSTKAKETAEMGAVAVENTIKGIYKISSAMEMSSTVVGTLGSNSEEISKIISVIDEIADQTNLLALNAAIEAARAGEAGRGFAVVADEVRKLAERTTKATKEIALMISKIQSDTAEAVGSMNMVMTEVKKEVALADKTEKALSQIVGQAQNTTHMVERIATASEEQSTTIEDISRNVNFVAEVSKETSDDTQKTSSSAQNLRELASELKSLVGQFKV